MGTSIPTRDRILDAAMSLFSEHGFKGTSVTQIESAAGLSPGSGAIYHHFRTKQDLLAAGVQRHLDRLNALRDIRELIGDLGEPRVELTVTARYVLAELDREQQLLRVLATEARAHGGLLDDAIDQLVRGSFAGFASWLRGQGLSDGEATALSAVGLGALVSSRLLRSMLGVDPSGIDDETFVQTWVQMMLKSIS